MWSPKASGLHINSNVYENSKYNVLEITDKKMHADSHFKEAIKMNVMNVESYTHALLIKKNVFDFIDQNLLISEFVEIRLHGNILRTFQSVIK